jgi:hypothetical protein
LEIKKAIDHEKQIISHQEKLDKINELADKSREMDKIKIEEEYLNYNLEIKKLNGNVFILENDSLRDKAIIKNLNIELETFTNLQEEILKKIAKSEEEMKISKEIKLSLDEMIDNAVNEYKIKYEKELESKNEV